VHSNAHRRRNKGIMVEATEATVGIKTIRIMARRSSFAASATRKDMSKATAG
jgi:hypothetical protein